MNQKARFVRVMEFCDSKVLRAFAVAASFGLFALNTYHAALRGGALEDDASALSHLPGRVASMAGFAADTISISGLSQHSPPEVLAALGIKPGQPIFGFDAAEARKKLETLPWVLAGSVAREYPNQLRIELTERKAIAVWQHGTAVDLVDGAGVAMGHMDASMDGTLPIVTGEGANTAVADLINQMSAIPGLSQKVSAAARVGGRRWTLYLGSGVKLALPESGMAEALKTAWDLDQSQNLFSKASGVIDMRQTGKVLLEVADAAP